MSRFASRRDFLRWAAVLAPASRLLAFQDKEDHQEKADARFSTEVNLVNVLATVRDKNHAIAHNLIKDDFTLEEDGRPQTITYFAQQSDLPLTLGLLVDTSGSERTQIESERRASYKFIDQVLREDKDKAFVIHFDREVELLQDLTASRTALDKSLDGLSVERPQRSGSGQGQGRGRGSFGGTTLYDAVLLASDELMTKQKGRKAVILLSDGVDNGSKVSLVSAIESAQRADTLVYSIRFAESGANSRGGFSGPGLGGGGRGRRGGGGRFPGGGAPGGGNGGSERADGKKVLERLSSETGGSYFEVSSKMPLDKIYSQIQDELRNQYSLGYTSDQTGAGYRRIHLTVKLKNMTVQTRDGYYAR
ncbi:MAG TPA: VWA domain-containing protein [Bryobacteraceae bacterium]|jgi:VWFA-related protein